MNPENNHKKTKPDTQDTIFCGIRERNNSTT